MTLPGINAATVLPWLDEHVPGLADGGELDIRLIGDGRSNLSYLVSNAAGRWVLRRPPLGHRVATAHDMAREFRVISAVAGAGFPVATPIALCTDPGVNELPFYVMGFVDGAILVDGMPAGFANPGQCRDLSRSFARTLAQLHAIDFNAVGLSDFGRPEGYLERQVRLWARQWGANKTRELPAIDELRRRLELALPGRSDAVIVHGDYRFGNLVLDRTEPSRINAVLDWEMSTLGDPLADLGYTLAYWRPPGDNRPRPSALSHYTNVTANEGFFTRDELIAEYERASGRDVTDIDFYEVFAFYKLAVITEGIWKRIVDGLQTGDVHEDYAQSSVECSEFALDIASRSANAALRGER